MDAGACEGVPPVEVLCVFVVVVPAWNRVRMLVSKGRISSDEGDRSSSCFWIGGCEYGFVDCVG